MGDLVPLRRSGWEKYKQDNHVVFYAFCAVESDSCKFFSSDESGKCAHAKGAPLLRESQCLNQEAHGDAFAKLKED